MLNVISLLVDNKTGWGKKCWANVSGLQLFNDAN